MRIWDALFITPVIMIRSLNRKPGRLKWIQTFGFLTSILAGLTHRTDCMRKRSLNFARRVKLRRVTQKYYHFSASLARLRTSEKTRSSCLTYWWQADSACTFLHTTSLSWMPDWEIAIKRSPGSNKLTKNTRLIFLL